MSKSIISFQTFDDAQATNYLADHYPKGKLTGRIHRSSSVMYKFILSLSTFAKVVIGNIYTLVINRDINQADSLLKEWETSVKIPEEIPRLDTLDARRAAVERLISKIPVYNEDNGPDVETTIANYLEVMSGFSGITVQTLAETNPTPETTDHFFFIIGVPAIFGELNNFPLSFPFPFASTTTTVTMEQLLNILMEKVAPSYTRWQIIIIA